MVWSVDANPVSPDEAIAWFRAKLLLPDSEFAELSDTAKRYAFSAAGATQLDVVTDLWRALDGAIADGTTFADFKRTIGEQMAEAWGRPDSGRLANIFRTNVMSAYGAGRWKQLEGVRESHPLGRFDAVMESRTCPICAELNGTVLRLDDPRWRGKVPPIHGLCRCEVAALHEGDAEVTEMPPEGFAQDGFGEIPRGEEWSPDISTKPPEIAEIYRRRAKGQGAGGM
ncbi:MAG: phage head morphogenesis protein [Thermoplasmataceae archaeon]